MIAACRNVNEFRRVILYYSPEGYAQSLTVEYYQPVTPEPTTSQAQPDVQT